MKRNKKRILSERFLRSLFLFILILGTLIVGCTSSAKSKVNVFCCQISPDNKTLRFEYYYPEGSKIAAYDVKTDKITLLNDEINKINEGSLFSPDGTQISYLGAKAMKEPLAVYIMNADGTNRRQITKDVQALGGALFSPDGKKLAFLGRKNSSEKYNLFIVNIDGSDLRQITTDQYVKGVPAFSLNGKKIIYKKSHRRRQRAFPLTGEMDADWDIYEYDLEKGIERRLTNYNFYRAYNPNYMSDGKRFTFAAEGPVNSKGPGPKNFEEYEKKYGKNFVFIMDGINNELKPAFTYGDNSMSCYKGLDDSRLFVSETRENNKRKTQELYLYKNGRITQLTNMNSYIVTGRLSRDNTMILFTESGNKGIKFWLMKTDGTGLKEIKIPRRWSAII